VTVTEEASVELSSLRTGSPLNAGTQNENSVVEKLMGSNFKTENARFFLAKRLRSIEKIEPCLRMRREW
jgi:hypothetical protein